MKSSRIKNSKAITLIALVVTIVIMLILAGITMTAIPKLIDAAQNAKDATNRSAAQEAVVMGWNDCEMRFVQDGNGAEKQAYFESNIKQSIDSQNEDGEYIEGDSTIDVNATSTINYAYKDKIYIFYVDEKGNVSYAGKKTQGEKEDIPRVEPAQSEYKLVGDIYCNSPDLSGFAKDATYYVTYDSEGNETIAGRIDTINAPDNWYNYSSSAKQWANVVTISGDQVAYWVWIPRYVYSLDTTNKMANTYFVSTSTLAGATEYKYRTKDGEQTLSGAGYSMPESFKFGGQELAGIWVSKYEVSESVASNSETVDCFANSNTIKVSTNNPTGNYKVFVDGVEKYNGALPHTFTGLVEDAEYDITVISETNGPIGRKKIWSEKIIKVDTSGFDKTSTFYVTYDENGKESYRRLDQGVPANWYDYSNKRWANLVTINENQVAYWTYIPRYEYITNTAVQTVDVRYIPKSQTTADVGYSIPESFNFGEKELAGFWTSKYEISEAFTANEEKVTYEEQSNAITVTTTKPSGDYIVLIDGKEKYQGSLPYTIKNPKSDEVYDVCVISKENGPIGRKLIQKEETNVEIDLSGFNKSTTYYVIYSSDGQTIESENIPISQELTKEQRKKWYNYDQKRWANIKTVSEDGSLVAYWTYIPRYEYIAQSTTQHAEIKFIPKTQIKADPGYQIPESFTFGGQNLAGFWSSKYELSNK